MNTLTKLTQEAKEKIARIIEQTAIVSLTKSATDQDSGTFKVVASTSDTDRQGESVKQDGWDLAFFKANPVVLWAHDYGALPIGMCTSIEVKDGKLVAEGKFAPAEANPFAQQVRKLYDLGMVNTTSVGFIPKEYDTKEAGVITKSELLEFSFVPVPANPYALRLNQIKELGIDTAMLKIKGIEIKEETEVKVDAETETETGAVAERLEEMNETKWAKYRPVCDVMDAFASVYFNEMTPTDDFSSLLNETIELLKKVAEGNDLDADNMVKEFYEKKNIKPIAFKEAIAAILRNHIALGSLTLSEGDKSSKEIEAAKERSKPSEALKEVNSFVETRELLRTIDNSIGKVLENFNRAARSR